MTSESERGEERWAGRPRAAVAIKAVVFIAPIVLSALATHLVAKVIPRPSGPVPTVAWWVGLSAFATGVLFVADKLARRLLPLAALLQLSLVFPDRAPSRFKAAIRTQTVHQLKQRVEEIRSTGLPDDPALAAETLIELVADLSAHDRLTRGHAERVRAYSRMIGEELDLDARELEFLQWAGLAHDVGKLFVPGEILNKPGRLTPEEFEVIKQHPARGAELCEPLRRWLGDWVDAVGQHHERWDGLGYPSGRSGEDIALAARIVSVADVYDVITSARSYKHPGSAVDGRHELARCAGTQFDPHVVRAFLNISLGRLRLIMGPLSWLGQLPVVGRAPVGPAAGAAVSAAATAVTLLAGGLLDQPALADRGAAVVEAAPLDDDVAAPLPTRTTIPGAVASTTVAPEPATSTVATSPPLVSTASTAVTSTAPTSTFVVTGPTTTLVVVAPTLPSIPVIDGNIGTLPVTTDRTVSTVASTIPPSPPPTQSGPIAVDDAANAQEGNPIDIDVAANDVDAVSASLLAPPAHGTVTRIGNTVFRFTPPPDWNGQTTFRYTVVDAAGASSSATVAITVSPTPDPPIASDDVVSVDEDDSVTVPVLNNDSDADGDALTVVSATTTDGTATTDGTVVKFVPEPNSYGTQTVRYTITDGTGRSASATVTVTVRARPDVPAAGDDAYSTPESTAFTAPAPGVLANDGDEDDDPLTAALESGPSNGSVALAPNGSFTYTPNALFVGTDTFTYVVADGTGRTDTGKVFVTVGSSGSAARFYLGTGGTGDWALSTAAPGPAEPEPDHDGDGNPGLTIEKSNQKLTETDPLEFQQWSVVPSSDLRLDGPVRLVLWSTAEDFDEDKDIDYSAWLLDCRADGTGCVTLASSLDVHVDEWNGDVEDWVEREIVIGSVDATVSAGRMLRLRLMFDHDDVWIALSGNRPSRLEYTRAS